MMSYEFLHETKDRVKIHNSIIKKTMMKSHKYLTKGGPLRQKSFRLADRIVKLYKYLIEQQKEYILSKHRAGTNPGAMVRESENAESDNDFIHKLSIAQKETEETQFWLELLFENDYLT